MLYLQKKGIFLKLKKKKKNESEHSVKYNWREVTLNNINLLNKKINLRFMDFHTLLNTLNLHTSSLILNYGHLKL